MMQKDKKYIAFVCTGNTCRSPIAEGIFNKLAEDKGLAVRAESFGVSAMTGFPVSENSVEVCREIDVDISAFRSTDVVDTDLSKFDAFYCMSQSHMALLFQCYGVALDKMHLLGVSDPYGGNTEIYRICRDEIYNSVEEIIKGYEN
ncbi:MAG: low molecular weight phosphatase family protein [Ruminococcus sp.]|nr:low molecular weight phosphatase family protein [Ruminococcus sp.]